MVNPQFVSALEEVRAIGPVSVAFDETWDALGTAVRSKRVPCLARRLIQAVCSQAISELACLESSSRDAVIDEMIALHDRKNFDYAHDADPLSNFHASRHFGVRPLLGVLVRMGDKVARLEQLRAGKTLKNEPVRDSLIDLAVYAVIAVLLLDEETHAAAA